MGLPCTSKGKSQEFNGFPSFKLRNKMREGKRVGYLLTSEMALIQYYPKEHPMKPKRVKMAHSLIKSMGIFQKLNIYNSRKATSEDMILFHSQEYVKYLQNYVNPNSTEIVKTLPDDRRRLDRKKPTSKPSSDDIDCPIYEGLYNFCQLSVGASLDCANIIITGQEDIAINWAGGYHHARKGKMSGFCYVNDIVICILQLLKFYPRVLYLDIDVHHGDGVEQAFYSTNRVMTVSFHQYGSDFFPGTGNYSDTGQGIGQGYSINVPLKPGIDDDSYFQIFKNVMNCAMDSYRPDVVVMQCGADSLSKDILGHLNLSVKGHGELVKFMMSKSVPLILLGGGGYTIQNVSRCWAYQTGLTVGMQLLQKIPQNDYYFKSYPQGSSLIFDIDEQANQNSKADLQKIQAYVLQTLRKVNRPNVEAHGDVFSQEDSEQNRPRRQNNIW